MSERILGIDPGTVRTGYGLLEVDGLNAVYVTSGVVTASRSLPLEQRLWAIYQGLLEVVERERPVEVAIEESFIPEARGAWGEARSSVRSAMAVGQAGAIAMLAAASHGVPIYRYAPTQVKSAVSEYGRSSKEQVQEMVRVILGLDRAPKPADAADALAVALCHLQQRHIATLEKAQKG
jgi:crossover junction endodeoxyribonuclease RuvC